MRTCPGAHLGLFGKKNGVFAALLLAGALPAAAQTLPTAFRDKVVFSGLTQPTAIAFSPDGRVFVTEKSGLIKVFASLSATTPTVFADLRPAVHNFWDRGLLGLALHPNFPATPYVYVLYTYDAAIGGTAPRWGPGDGTSDPCPTPPGATGDGCVVSGRLSRLQAAGDVMTGTEQVLLEDWFQQYPSHSIGSVIFGNDGMLYVSGGDGGSFNFADYGQDGNPLNPGGEPPVGVGGTQTPPTAEGGALRAQRLRTAYPSFPIRLNGSVARVDPDTGAALSSNPLFSNPDPNAKRIIAEGLRNPFRITARPGTNEIWVGDVGWGAWEEINRITDPTTFSNFGWPCYEGAGHQPSYDNLGLNICANLYAAGASAVKSPVYAYAHSQKIVAGESCSTGSSSITGLAFYTGTSYPSTYQKALFFTDYSRQCIWTMLPNANGDPNPANRQTFEFGAASPVQLTIGPGGDVFYVDINAGKIHRIEYFVPSAAITATPTTGPAPLTVNFDGTGSTDPDPAETLSYSWDLNGDGVFDDATTATTSYTFTAAGNYTVTLRVTDTHGGTDTETAVISVGNAPPVPTIATPDGTLKWQVNDTINFSGSAVDPQTGPLPASALSWTVLIHHCPSDCHLHTIQTFSGTASGSFSAPDHEYPSYLELKLTATGSSGLQGSTSVLLYPQTVSVDLETNPSGLELSWDSLSGAAPLSTAVIIGSRNSLSAPSPQVLNGSSYEFASWSDAGAATHNVIATSTPISLTANFVLQPPPSSVSANPATVAGGTGSTGTVVLSGPAPGAGAVVALSSSNTTVASVPASVTVPSGATSATFAVTTSSVASDTPITLSAFYGGGTATGSLLVTVPANQPPTVALTGPTNGSAYTAPASIALQATAGDTDGSVVRVDFYSGPTLLGSATTAPYGFTWSNVPQGNYTFTAVATDDRSATATSTPVSVTVTNPANPVPAPWTAQDVGAVGVAGNSTFFSGTYSVAGSGADIGGTSDQFQYVSQPLSGDGQIVARVASVQNTNVNAKGGIMVRQSLAGNSVNVAMLFTGGNRLQFQRRTATGGSTTYSSWAQGAPYWVKLVRAGTTFTGYKSANGTTWTLAGTFDVPMSGNVTMGLVMSSHDNTSSGTATFDNVSVVTGTPNPPPSVSLTAPANNASFADPTSITISANATDDGSVAKVELFDGPSLLTTLNGTGPYNYVWNAPPSGSHTLTARATDNLGATATSAAVTVTVTYSGNPLPSPWTHADVGAVGIPGTSSYSSGTFTVTGSGADIGGTSDQFQFAYQPFSGDVQIVARIATVQNTSTSAKAAIVIRDGLGTNAANAAFVITPAGRIQFQRRLSAGATTTYSSWTQAAPYWFKLVRTGDTVTAYRSPNGIAWTNSGAFTIPMGATVDVGLGMSSHTNAASGAATFDNVIVSAP